jgi:DNA-binding response OmpR family regulator
MAPESILIIDEDKEFLAKALDFLIVQMNLENVIWAVTPEEAEEKMRIFNPRIVILDLGTKKLRGEEISSVINSSPNPPIIIMTSYEDNDDYLDLTHDLGADGFFKKDRLKTALPKLLEYLNPDNNNDKTDNHHHINNYNDLFRDKSFLLN